MNTETFQPWDRRDPGQDSKNKSRARDEIQVSPQVCTQLGRKKAKGSKGRTNTQPCFRSSKNKGLLHFPRHVMGAFKLPGEAS